MADANGNEDIKAKMREALDRKQGNDRGVPKDQPVKEKAHGSEVTGEPAQDAPAQGWWRGLLTRPAPWDRSRAPDSAPWQTRADGFEPRARRSTRDAVRSQL